ncbi:PDDEXK nuclease domain-containing protein [Spirosoma pollinicola]|uniref:Cytoplasmic protein n=1 Tax=Spirosoma pollinicola TaxID=2057025 RepID=A0A2K8Z9F5_9BACT|nr:PDDEXK nuclease domain-containing protein [Spirosoma pollinicola]AUD06480.1 cytoplasmic protein [Spirosoma pollinicola]
MKFSELITTLEDLQQQLNRQAVRQADQLMALRNWLIGFYIVEYEQLGDDRATYGQNPIPRIAQAMKQQGVRGFSDRNLYLFKNFYLTYPNILQFLTAKFQLTDFEAIDKKALSKYTPPDDIPLINYGLLFERLTFTHFVELMKVEDPLRRRFYEVEALKNAWTVEELNRAITTSLAERTGLSTDKAAVIARVKDNAPAGLTDYIRNPYLLEFLNIKEKAEFSENDLETAIINHLQDFLLELGHGFCFEARQKRISFDNRHYRIDLVFYHRVLKCHVLIDLKIGEFDHADAGQMNMYLNYYADQEATKGDNPPIGIILCASKNNAMAKYATSGLAHEVFVSQYLTNLPAKEELQAFIERESRSIVNQ